MLPRQLEIKRLLDLGMIEEGQSDYASSMIFVESAGKDQRLFVDYRKLNRKSRTEFFPLQNIEEVVEKIWTPRQLLLLWICYFQIFAHKRSAEICIFCNDIGDFLTKNYNVWTSTYYFCRLIAIF